MLEVRRIFIVSILICHDYFDKKIVKFYSAGVCLVTKPVID